MTRPSIAGGVSFDLAALDGELRKEFAYEASGYTARTLVREPDLRVVLIAMKAGARMVDHRVETTASVYVLSGLLRLHFPDGRWICLRTICWHWRPACDTTSRLWSRAPSY